ncbi:MAG: DUF1295 domain-containing protein [Burkholderiales bacterium]|nr:DUF1295 domain-containing protein [Burkholderiales bacterium]MDE2454424.1 DUF1295 domain-containing protein [Burkholderiales bacterium]
MSDALFLACAALWGLLAVAWLTGVRRLSCWRPSAKDYLFPLLPLLLLGALAALAPPALAGFWRPLARSGLVIWGWLSLVWVASVLRRDSSLMDLGYALCVVFSVWLQWIWGGADSSPRALLILVLVNLWGWRYTAYIAARNLPRGEDTRYARWRARTGAAWWWWSYFQVFLLQAVLIWIWTLPLTLALAAPGPIGALETLATAVWLVGFVFEAGADWQLARFKRDPSRKGRVLDQGLWSQCRHPNYFGEAAIWCAYGLLALAHPAGWIGLFASAYTVHMMNGGSATRMTDAYLMKTRPAYADYARRTPAFLPRVFGGRP